MHNKTQKYNIDAL